MEPVDVQQTGMKAPPLRWSEEPSGKGIAEIEELADALGRLQQIVAVLSPHEFSVVQPDAAFAIRIALGTARRVRGRAAD